MTRLVAAAALIRDGLLLAAQRSSPPELAGQWELPGGKVEDGESPEDALRRELREELGIEIAIGAQVRGPRGGDWDILNGYRMRVWLCTLAGGEPRPLQDHQGLAWVSLDDAETLTWLGPDLPIVRAVGAELRSYCEQ